jgi:hypothetical protein
MSTLVVANRKKQRVYKHIKKKGTNLNPCLNCEVVRFTNDEGTITETLLMIL